MTPVTIDRLLLSKKKLALATAMEKVKKRFTSDGIKFFLLLYLA